CLKCHGGASTHAGIKILDRDLLVTKKKVVVPANPEESKLFQRLTTTDEESVMPPEGPRLRPDDVAAVRQWIAAGAPAFPADETVPVESVKDQALPEQVGVDYVLKQ